MNIDQGHPARHILLDRPEVRWALRRAGLVDETSEPLPGDTPEVAQLLADSEFGKHLIDLAGSLGRDPDDVRVEAAGYLREMGATHTGRAVKDWARFGRWLARAHDLVVDPEQVQRLRALDRTHSLLFPFSHKSYLDGVTVPAAIARHGIASPFVLAGTNLNKFPFNELVRRSGFVYIRRSTTGNQVYRLVLRSYITQMIRNRRNLCWSIEGGRTRTGKLRPPAYGILHYMMEALEAAPGSKALIVPVAVVYEQLHEVGMMTDEAHGVSKRPEDLRWLWNFGRSQRERFGRAYVEFGEPFPLPERPADAHPVERVALEICHRINRATPVTTTAVVCLALLSADRAMTLDEVLATVDPIARYLSRRGRPVAGAADLTDRATIRHALDDLVRSGVLAGYDGGTDTVWGIVPGRHLVAAFYRNTAVHMLVDRAIGELGLVAAAEGGADALRTANRETLRLRDLLKFDFFFPSRRQFAEEMAEELAIVDPGRTGGLTAFEPADARRWLENAEPLVAHLVLRPWLEAYYVVADRLAALPEDEVLDEKEFLAECLRVGRQWALQRRLASEESVSLELFKPALQLARHRDLVIPGPAGLAARRAEFRDELRTLVGRVNSIAELARRDGR